MPSQFIFDFVGEPVRRQFELGENPFFCFVAARYVDVVSSGDDLSESAPNRALSSPFRT
jgi:hypothetical protein